MGLAVALVLDEIWCFKSHYPVDISLGRWRADSVFWGLGGKSKLGRETAQPATSVAERQPSSILVASEPLSSDLVRRDRRFATQLAEVGAREEARVMNQDKPISNA